MSPVSSGGTCYYLGMFANLERHDWNFWMWWVGFTAVASSACFVVISLALFWLNLPFVDNAKGLQPTLIDQVVGSLFFALAGATIGFGQWPALRMIVPRSAWWILISGAGWLAGYWTYIIVNASEIDHLIPTLAQFVPWLIIGLWTGLFQWLFLRRFYTRAEVWLVVTTVAIIIGGSGWNVGSICGGVFFWAAAGAITGYTLLRFEANKAEYPVDAKK